MSSGVGETGWLIDLNGEAINLAHVRRIRIGSRFQEVKSLDERGDPDGVSVFYVTAELAGQQYGDDRPVLVQNLADRAAAEHWIAVRFWQPSFDLARETFSQRSPAAIGGHESIEALVYDSSIPAAQRVEMLRAMADIEVVATQFGWVVSDHRANKSWDVRRDA